VIKIKINNTTRGKFIETIVENNILKINLVLAEKYGIHFFSELFNLALSVGEG